MGFTYTRAPINIQQPENTEYTFTLFYVVVECVCCAVRYQQAATTVKTEILNNVFDIQHLLVSHSLCP